MPNPPEPSRSRMMLNYLGTQWRRLFGLNISQITDLLFVGGEFQAAEWPRLHEMGIRAVLSLQAEHEDVFEGPAPERTLRIPVIDHTAPSLEQLREAVGFLAAAHDEGLPVMVHCHAGVGRAPLAAAAFLVSRGMPSDDAVDLIARARPIIGLNEKQYRRLKEWEQFLRSEE